MKRNLYLNKCYIRCLLSLSGAGIQWNNFYKPPTVDGNFSMLAVILILILDTVLYMIVAWYVDAIRPGDFGVPQPFYFPFTVSI